MTGLRRIFTKYKYLYLLLAPGFLFTAVFSYTPLYGLYMAFSDYKLGKPILSSRFVGLSNFKEFIIDSVDMLNLLRNTVVMNVLSLVFTIFGAMALAILLNEVRIGSFKRIVQTTTFFPFFISWVTVYNIFNVFLTVETGVINTVLKDFGVIENGINFLANPNFSWVLIPATNLWKTIGYNSVLFLASISGIESSLYEAARIDGADRIQRITYITIPSIMPTLQVLLILNMGWIFISNFDQFYLFTNALNRPTMEVFDMYVYRFGLKQLNYSYATAVGMAKSLAGVIMIVTVNTVSKKLSGKGVF